jgi:hypothetical protein
VAFKRNEGVLPKIDYLPLSGAPGLQLVANTLKASKGISSPTYVSQTFLQYASVFIGKELTSWVTDTRGTPPPAVEGAEVSVYLSVYGKVGGTRVCVRVQERERICCAHILEVLRARAGVPAAPC